MPAGRRNMRIRFELLMLAICRKFRYNETFLRCSGNQSSPALSIELSDLNWMAELSYTVRFMRQEDISQALDVWRETGMHGGTRCYYTWLEVDPEGFSVAVTDAGEVLAVCCAVHNHKDLAFVGYYAVRKKYRGLGIGYKVWNACMQHIGSRNAALNAVLEKVELYRDKGGFPIVEKEWVNLINETTESVQVDNLDDNLPAGIEIQPYEPSILPEILEYDRRLIGYERDLAIRLNCEEEDSHTLVALKEGVCVGFGTIKISCQKAGQVGPLYADDSAVAEAVLKRLIQLQSKAQGFTMMTISTNVPANEFIAKLGCPMTGKCPRLYRKEPLKVDIQKVFAHFDLGFSPF